jgi:8-amino-3,8-dideoxy-alpha-D-manno-octulosonate transaminase
MDRIMEIARKHDLLVIEDCCQAAGASYKGKKVGSIGDVGAFSLNIFKTINTGDGGLLVTNNKSVYERAFGIHDQGHKPNRFGVEIGERSVLGFNFRMNEITAAVGLAQLGKLESIVSQLQEKRDAFKQLIQLPGGAAFRKLNDPEDCATIVTVIFDSHEMANAITGALGTTTLDKSGWHVYSSMEHILRHLKEVGQPAEKGAYPRTDDILARSMNISIGVVDPGIGTSWGINIKSSEEEIKKAADQFNAVCNT